MKTTTEYNSKGGFRFVHAAPIEIGQRFTHLGEIVRVVGMGMAGMPEVELADGSTELVMPNELKPCTDSVK